VVVKGSSVNLRRVAIWAAVTDVVMGYSVQRR
jgi:hypothetical protein